jgi:hypothetical protein
MLKYHAAETYIETGIELQTTTLLPQGKEPSVLIE